MIIKNICYSGYYISCLGFYHFKIFIAVARSAEILQSLIDLTHKNKKTNEDEKVIDYVAGSETGNFVYLHTIKQQRPSIFKKLLSSEIYILPAIGMKDVYIFSNGDKVMPKGKKPKSVEFQFITAPETSKTKPKTTKTKKCMKRWLATIDRFISFFNDFMKDLFSIGSSEAVLYIELYSFISFLGEANLNNLIYGWNQLSKHLHHFQTILSFLMGWRRSQTCIESL